MTLEQFAYLAEIIAALAVIASLIYIATELRQNTAALQAQSRFNLINIRRQFSDALMQDRELIRILHRYANGQELTEEERTAVRLQAMNSLDNWEWQYGEYQSGTLPIDRLPVNAWRRLFHDKIIPNAIAETWEERKGAMNKEFVEFMEQQVVSGAAR